MNAVIYARYSSDNQRSESIDAQVRAMKKYAEQNGMTIMGTYIDVYCIIKVPKVAKQKSPVLQG